MFKVLVLVLLVAAATALPASNEKNGNEDPLASADCTQKDSFSCIKYKVFSLVDKKLSEQDDITLSDGITIVKTSNAEEGAPRLVSSHWK